MRIVFSRKGFDASCGGVPSPILPDGRLVSLPIPMAGAPRTFAQVDFDGAPLASLLRGLAPAREFGSEPCHLDPDLRAEALPRLPGWRPMFGQVGAAQRHLENQQVSVGDLFLFYGWFRRVRTTDEGPLRYQVDAPHEHVLFGWLQIGAIHRDMRALLREAPWASDHPHLSGTWPATNALYLASPRLLIGGQSLAAAGGGVFGRYHEGLRLTAPGRSRSVWLLPRFFHPRGRSSTLSYHASPDRWRRFRGQVLLESARIGQEFVLDVDDYPEALPWLGRLFERATWPAQGPVAAW